MKGHVEQLPSGRWRARRGKETIGTYDSETQALAALGGSTLASQWEAFAVRRRRLVRDWANDESRWELYFAPDAISAVPLTELARAHALQWLHRMIVRGLAAQTIRNAVNLARVFCAELLDLGLVAENAFSNIKLPRGYGARSDDAFTVLDPDEQIALLDHVDDDEYHLVAFALHTGLRSSEIWNLKFEDVDLEADEIVVRRSRGGLPTKTGKPRRVPLIGLARQAVQWAFDNRRCEYVWPSPRTGQKRHDSAQPHHWRSWLKAAGLKRRVRFYDLRHTCATSLLAGWWGRKWSLDEVRQILGHTSVKTTERYAHLVDDTLRRAGKATAGLDPTSWGEPGASSRDRTGDLRFTNSPGLEGFQLLALARLHARLADQHDLEARGAHALVRAIGVAVRLAKGTATQAEMRAALSEAVVAFGFVELPAARVHFVQGRVIRKGRADAG